MHPQFVVLSPQKGLRVLGRNLCDKQYQITRNHVFAHTKFDNFYLHTDTPTRMISYQYVPHKAAAEVSKIANYSTLTAVNHGSQSRSTDGSESGWRQGSVVVVVIVDAM